MSLRAKLLLILADILTEYVQAFIAIITTIGYLGAIFLCLIYATIPVYQADFEILLKWSVIPGFIWGAYFTARTVQQVSRSKRLDEL